MTGRHGDSSKWVPHGQDNSELFSMSNCFSHMENVWVISPLHMGGTPKIGGKTPKWMVKIMENPIKMDDLGVPLIFGNIHIIHSPQNCHLHRIHLSHVRDCRLRFPGFADDNMGENTGWLIGIPMSWFIIPTKLCRKIPYIHKYTLNNQASFLCSSDAVPDLWGSYQWRCHAWWHEARWCPHDGCQ